MRICVLNYEYPPLGGGGGQLSAQVATGLVARGHHLRVITAGMPYLPKESIENGVEILRLRSFRGSEATCSVFEMLLWVIIAIPSAIAEIKYWKPDILHVHFAVPTGIVALVAHYVTGIPYMLTAHLGDVPGGVPEQTRHLFPWIKPLTFPIWKRAIVTTAVSNFVATLVKKAYGISPQVILNGIELPAFSSLKSHTIPRLLMVGRMSVQKNPLTAIRALGLLKKFSWTCSIIGDGPLLEAMKREAARLEILERIDFQGWVSSSSVRVTMQASDILLIPSLSEGLPMVTVEALAYGLAIVGSRIAGLQDVTYESGQHANACLFSLNHGAEGFAKALQYFLMNADALIKARKASLCLSARFELQHSLDQYEKNLMGAIS